MNNQEKFEELKQEVNDAQEALDNADFDLKNSAIWYQKCLEKLTTHKLNLEQFLHTLNGEAVNKGSKPIEDSIEKFDNIPETFNNEGGKLGDNQL